MQNYADRANELIERIDDGKVDPADVDITPFVEREDAVLTPGLADRLPEEKIEEYSHRVQKRDRRDLAELQAEESAEAADAREILMGLGADTATVDLAELDDNIEDKIELEVKTEIPGWIERELEKWADKSHDERVTTMIQAATDMIVSPEKFAEEKAWADVYEQRGSGFLDECLHLILTPAMEREELVRGFRGE